MPASDVIPVIIPPSSQPQPKADEPVAQAPSPLSGSPLLDMLLSEHAITQEQVTDIKVKSSTTGASVEEILRSLHIVDETKIAEVQARLLGIPFISLANTAFSPEALSFVPRPVAERFRLIR